MPFIVSLVYIRGGRQFVLDTRRESDEDSPFSSPCLLGDLS